MNTISCAVKGCASQFSTEEEFCLNATYVCKNHHETTQKLHFQDVAFDPALNPGESNKSQSEEYDRDWGMSGDPMSLSEKCEHGVYDPMEDQRYCSICNPIKLTAVVREIKKTNIGKIGIFKNPNEQIDQAGALILFYYKLPAHLQPAWFKEQSLSFRTIAKRVFGPRLKGNKFFGADQFPEEENEQNS